MYTPLHCHSTYSFHAGVCSPEDLAARAASYGLKAVALTDTNRMSGLIRFYLACRSHGIKPILGVELTDPSASKRASIRIDESAGLGDPTPLRSSNAGVVILARNAQGYGDLCEIITQRHVDPDFTFADIFAKPWPNCFFLTGFPHLLRQLAATPNRSALYGEVVNNGALTRRRSHQLEAVARELSFPLAATNNSYFLDPDDHDTHRILSAIGLVSTLSRLEPHETSSRNGFLKSAEQMTRLFPAHPEVIANTARIADRCNVELELGKWILPRIDVPTGHTPESYLAKIAGDGLEQNYGGTAEYERAKEIQATELDVITKLGYPSYFIMVKQVRDWANERLSNGYRRPKDCTILRGSAANSITFYNIGASDLDPIKYDLYFQRFLNEDRASPPDADLDFGWDERDEVLEHVVEKWGRDRVAITCTTNHFRGRAAFRETAKVFGYTEEEISEIQKKPQNENAPNSRRRTRTHHDHRATHQRKAPVPRPASRRAPHHQRPPSAVTSRVSIPAVPKIGSSPRSTCTAASDELGLIKFDLLGNGSLSVLRDGLRQLSDQGYPDPEVWDLEKCYHDERVLDLIKKGRTKGHLLHRKPPPSHASTKRRRSSRSKNSPSPRASSAPPAPLTPPHSSTVTAKPKPASSTGTTSIPTSNRSSRKRTTFAPSRRDVTKICHQVAGLSFKKS